MKKSEHKYLLYLYSQVDSYLSGSKTEDGSCFPDKLVYFCTVVEKLIKIKLHKKNPVLIFDSSNFKDSDSLAAIINMTDKTIETIKIEDLLGRCKLCFPSFLSENELKILVDVYHIRNQFIHGYKTDNLIEYIEEDIINKMGTIWEKVSFFATALFGDELIKKNMPKKKYSEEELEKVLEEEVRSKIQARKSGINTRFIYGLNEINSTLTHYGLNNDECPRCGSFAFELNDYNHGPFYVTRYGPSSEPNFLDLYKCNLCGLELTKKEYDIAKKIKMAK